MHVVSKNIHQNFLEHLKVTDLEIRENVQIFNHKMKLEKRVSIINLLKTGNLHGNVL